MAAADSAEKCDFEVELRTHAEDKLIDRDSVELTLRDTGDVTEISAQLCHRSTRALAHALLAAADSAEQHMKKVR
jgi:hypothetical protein